MTITNDRQAREAELRRQALIRIKPLAYNWTAEHSREYEQINKALEEYHNSQYNNSKKKK